MGLLVANWPSASNQGHSLQDQVTVIPKMAHNWLHGHAGGHLPQIKVTLYKIR